MQVYLYIAAQQVQGISFFSPYINLDSQLASYPSLLFLSNEMFLFEAENLSFFFKVRHGKTMASQKLHQLVSLLVVLLVFLGQAMETNGELSHCDYPSASATCKRNSDCVKTCKLYHYSPASALCVLPIPPRATHHEGLCCCQIVIS